MASYVSRVKDCHIADPVNRLNARTTLRNITNNVNFVGDSNFQFESTVPSNNVNVAMTKVTERWESDRGMDSDSQGTIHH
ncbi:hypothetical protein C0995_002261 [Termitomyces sp. Mi166|nr:hypothetical protein C0995_002261 [Termitomyces sp. Mi166\